MGSKNALMGILGGILTIGVVSSIAISTMTLKEVHRMNLLAQEAQNSQVEQETETSAAEPTTEENKEDGVVIAQQYTIESTVQISDAYKSGDTSKLSESDKETLEMADKILKKVIKDDMTDFDKEVAVYKWMTKNITNGSGMMTVVPKTSQENARPHGVLKYHNAVCVGYATTFRLFMQMLGIDCMVIHNNELYHSWDLVKIEDGWYHVDVYSDAGTTNYANFNQCDSMRGSEQSWDTEYFPKAETLKFNWAYMKKKDCDDVYKIAKLLRKAIDKKKANLMLDFGRKITEDNQRIGYTIVSNIENLLMNNSDGSNGTLGTYNWIEDPSTKSYLLNININYPNNGTVAGELTEEQIEKVNNIVNESFSDMATVDMNNSYAY